jgi:hypothetical protein
MLGIVIPAFVATVGKTSVGKKFCHRFEQMLMEKISKMASAAKSKPNIARVISKIGVL